MRPEMIVGLAGLLCSGTAWADGTIVAHDAGSTSAPYGYTEYFPPGYDASSALYPIVIFLHGSGEQGPGTGQGLYNATTVHGPLRLVREALANGQVPELGNRGVAIFAPQSPTWWSGSTIGQFIDYLVAEHRVDRTRIYVTGLSMGGGGTWELVRNRPDLAAAVVPICGAAQVGANGTSAFEQTPAWAFHAWGDGTVNRSETIGWANAIAAHQNGASAPSLLATYPHQNGDTNLPAADTQTGRYTPGQDWDWQSGVINDGPATIRVTFYTDSAHDSWTRTYANSAMWDWLLSQVRPIPGLDAGLPPVDAGFAGDATPDDVGPDPDAGLEEDAGLESDAGLNGDAGPEDDAGQSSDGGPSDAFVPDLGSPADAGPSTDAQAQPGLDAGPSAEAGPLGSADASALNGSCGCTSHHAGAKRPLGSLGGLLLGWVLRRQRRRGAGSGEKDERERDPNFPDGTLPPLS